MQDNFFDDQYSEPTPAQTPANDAPQQPSPQHQQNNQFAEYEQHRDAPPQDQYQGFQQPTVPQQSHYFQSIVPEQVTPEMLEMRRRDEEIQGNLERKRSEQRRLKEERKVKGRQELEQFKVNREKEIERNRKRNEEQASNNSVKAKNYGNQWEKVVDNIATKGDYPGKKDVNRMKEAIIKKSKD